MMKLPSPMKTSRVREALVAVAHYVEFAHKIAANVQPVSLITQTITPVFLQPRPSIDLIKPCSDGIKFTVSGNNLDKVKDFKITSDAHGVEPVDGGKTSDAKLTSVNFSLNNNPLDPGEYTVWLFDDQGSPGSERLVIESPAPTPQPGKANSNVAAVIPNEVVVCCGQGEIMPEKVNFLIISEGDSFPAGIKFESANRLIKCGNTIQTGNPKNLIIPVEFVKGAISEQLPAKTTNTGKSAGDRSTQSSCGITIKVESNNKASPSTFEFNLWLL